MFEWKDEYSVSIASLDGQHRNLLQVAEELHRAVLAGTGQDALGRVFDRLIQYVGVHFAFEERLMEESGYPGVAAHKAEHEALTQKVLQLQADFRAGSFPITIQLIRLLQRWLVNDTVRLDQEYVPYLKRKLGE